ncbi:hypothetical protein VTN02DRAFT_1714 [Thermoascus thermophilus]
MCGAPRPAHTATRQTAHRRWPGDRNARLVRQLTTSGATATRGSRRAIAAISTAAATAAQPGKAPNQARPLLALSPALVAHGSPAVPIPIVPPPSLASCRSISTQSCDLFEYLQLQSIPRALLPLSL